MTSRPLIDAVYNHSKSKATTRFVMLVITCNANRDNLSKISQGAISKATNCSIRQVKRAVDDLVKSGELTIESEPIARKESTTYKVLLPISWGNVSVNDVAKMSDGGNENVSRPTGMSAWEPELSPSLPGQPLESDDNVTPLKNKKELKNKSKILNNETLDMLIAHFSGMTHRYAHDTSKDYHEKWIEPCELAMTLAGNDVENAKMLIADSVSASKQASAKSGKSYPIISPKSIRNFMITIKDESDNKLDVIPSKDEALQMWRLLCSDNAAKIMANPKMKAWHPRNGWLHRIRVRTQAEESFMKREFIEDWMVDYE